MLQKLEQSHKLLSFRVKYKQKRIQIVEKNGIEMKGKKSRKIDKFLCASMLNEIHEFKYKTKQKYIFRKLLVSVFKIIL